MPAPDPTAAAPGGHAGGCLCGAVRFRVTAEPLQTTICHCTFCQRLTGSAYLVEPIFKIQDVVLSGEAPKVYERRSEGSGKAVQVNFCGRCGTTIFLGFERFPTVLGICAGTFDDPNWFDRRPGKARHIFTRHAQDGVVLPPGVEIYLDHAIALEGTPNARRVLAAPEVVKRR
jgi:hypothetical protein